MNLRIGLKGINQQGSEMEKVYSYYCGILLLVVFALVSIPSGAVAKKLLDLVITRAIPIQDLKKRLAEYPLTS